MRAVVSRIPLVALMACLAVAPIELLAQERGGSEDAAGEGGSGDRGNGAADDDAPTEGEQEALRRLETPEALSESQLAAMSPGERLGLVGASLDGMRVVLTAVNGLLEKTREEQRDVLKLNCINEKLSAIKGFVKVSEKAQLGLQDAINRSDVPEQVHQTKLVQLADLRVKALGQEAEACTGNAIPYSGPTDLDLDIDPDVRTDNPTDVDTTDVTTDPLPDASPYQ